MPYGNVDDRLAFHPKVIAAGNAAMGMWVRGLSWTTGARRDGLILPDIAKAIGTPAQANSLVKAGLWEIAVVTGGFIMHDFDDHNMTSDQWDELSRKRAEAGRKGGQSRGGRGASA